MCIKRLIAVFVIILHVDPLFGLSVSVSYVKNAKPESFFIINDTTISNNTKRLYSQYLYKSLIGLDSMRVRESEFVENDKQFLSVVLYVYRNIKTILYNHSEDYCDDYKYRLVSSIKNDSLLNLVIKKVLDYSSTSLLLLNYERVNYSGLDNSILAIERKAFQKKNFYILTHVIIYYHNLNKITKRDKVVNECKSFAEDDMFNKLMEFLNNNKKKKISYFDVIGTVYNW